MTTQIKNEIEPLREKVLGYVFCLGAALFLLNGLQTSVIIRRVGMDIGDLIQVQTNNIPHTTISSTFYVMPNGQRAYTSINGTNVETYFANKR